MSIFDFKDYRAFLKSEIKSRPHKGRGELSRISDHLGVNSTMLSQVMSGLKEFSLEQAKRVCDYLALPKLETDYFLILVQLERAGTHDLKDYFREKREEMKKSSLEISKRIRTDRSLTDLERSVFYSSGLYSAIHIFTSLESGKTLEQVVEKFNIPRSRVQEILRFLLEAGLVSSNNGIFIPTVQSTHIEKGSPFLVKHHSNWRVAAIQKSESLSSEEMMFTANISISKKDFEKIREQLVTAIQEISQIVKDSPSEEIANLNIDWFWI